MFKKVCLSFIAVLVSFIVSPNAEAKVKCYGIAKAGENDCSSVSHACAGQNKSDNDRKEWKFIEDEGACNGAGGTIQE